jgi:hypothetical protein
MQAIASTPATITLHALDDTAATLTMLDDGRLSMAGFGFGFGFCEALREMGHPVSGQHLGVDDLPGTVALPDLLGAAFFRGFAILRSNRVRVDQFLGEGGLDESE